MDTRSQLRQIRQSVIGGDLDGPSPSPRMWVKDGVDHINLQLNGLTELGRKLSIAYNCHLDHPVLGPFLSMEALWQYINSEQRDDRLRVLSGNQLRVFSKQLTKVRVVNFRAMIIDSYYQRIVSDAKVKEMLVNSDLALDCYYTNSSGVRIRRVFFKWFLMGLEEIRSALKEDRQPNYSFFIDDASKGLYSDIVN